jgi:ribose 5-phosphate isomerase RpiB
MKYEGGSLPLDQHGGVKVTLESEKVTIKQGKQTHSVSVKSITEISYGADVHRRVGAAIGVGVVTLGIGALMALVKTKKHFVGMTWDEKSGDATSAKKGGIVFKVGKGEYRGFIAALEGFTGLKAVNADSVGSGGTAKP